MCLANRARAVVGLFAASLLLTSCVERVRTVVRAGHPASQTLLTATKAELIMRVAQNYNSLQSFSATVDLTSSVGSVNKGKIKDYTDITTYIDFRKPDDIRIVGILPVVHTTAFHMVSDGKEFRVSIPLKSRFIEGRNDAPGNSANRFENVRPQAFLSGMLIKPVDPATDLVLFLDDTTETTAFYQLGIVRKVGEELVPYRRITFDRVNLQIVEQREYDGNGAIVSLSKYDGFKIFDNIRFPSRIEISRPKDEYGIVLLVEKMEINKPLDNARFVLVRPEGSELQIIGAPPAAHPAEAAKAPKW
jgi:hypothetical protein